MLTSTQGTPPQRSSPPASENASLTGLPPEVFEMVAEAVGPADLFTIRLLNKEAAEKVFQVYVRRTFANLNVEACSESSVATAKEAAQHPVIGKAITTVTIIIDGLGKREDVYKHHSSWNNLKSITSLFALLGDRMKRLHLTCNTDDSPMHAVRPRWGRETLERDLLHAPCPLLDVVLAAKEAGVKITDFSTYNWSVPAIILGRFYEIQGATFRVTEHDTTFLANLEKLELDLFLYNFSDKRPNEALFNWISSAPRLKHLILSTGTIHDNEYHGQTMWFRSEHRYNYWLLDPQYQRKLPLLEKFEMRNADRVGYDNILTFLARNAAIKEVRFEGTDIFRVDMSSLGQGEDKHPLELLLETTGVQTFESDGGFWCVDRLGYWDTDPSHGSVVRDDCPRLR